MTINQQISLTLGVVVIVASGGLAINQHIQNQRYAYSAPTAKSTINQPTTTPTKTPAPTKTAPPIKIATPVQTTVTLPAKAPGTYTLADVALHNSAASCWSAVNSGVYDLTPFVNQHPGGSGAILSLCGIDGSAAFNDQHGGQRRPANELVGFQIGTLVQ